MTHEESFLQCLYFDNAVPLCCWGLSHLIVHVQADICSGCHTNRALPIMNTVILDLRLFALKVMHHNVQYNDIDLHIHCITIARFKIT